MRGAEAACPPQADPELDLPVAQHVRIGCAPAGVFGEEVGKDPLAIVAREVRPVQRDGELGGDRTRILVVLRGGAVMIVLVLPVAHEEPLHLPAGLL